MRIMAHARHTVEWKKLQIANALLKFEECRFDSLKDCNANLAINIDI